MNAILAFEAAAKTVGRVKSYLPRHAVNARGRLGQVIFRLFEANMFNVSARAHMEFRLDKTIEMPLADMHRLRQLGDGKWR